MIALLAVADNLRIPDSILLVVAGLGISFIPSLPQLSLDPAIVFLLFLPPVLYHAASQTSWHDFKTEIGPISTLAIALVFLTTVAVATASYFLIPGFTWPMAFVLGAIVSPPDAVAATNITRGLGLNRRIVTILEGESLVNDASALVAYRYAIAAVGTGVCVLWQAGLHFIFVVCGGIIAGIVVGYLLIQVHKRILNNSTLSTSLTLLTPFIAYLTAERFHTSGVLAVVSAGLLISWRAPEIFSYNTRIRNRAVWSTVIFLLNGFIFILIGMQMASILKDLEGYKVGHLVIYGLIVSGVTIAIRILWVFGSAYSPFTRKQHDTWKGVLIVAWTGTRGIVSLATALALPLTLDNGDIFPQRSLILFLAFIVIFVTLVIQGVSLPLLIKILKVHPVPGYSDQEKELRLLVANRVLNFVHRRFTDPQHLHAKARIERRFKETANFLSKELADAVPGLEPDKNQDHDPSAMLHITTEIHQFQRELLINFHKEGLYDQSIIRQLELELDHEESQLNRKASRKVI